MRSFGKLFFVLCGVWLGMPLEAEARKCPPGQYGVFKCIKCPAGTYAYKDHIATKIGCKKCPSGKYSKAGWRKCKSRSCTRKVKGSKKTFSEGSTYCDLKANRKKKCKKASWVDSGACRVCSKKDHHGYRRNYKHGYKYCKDRKWRVCQDGSWVKKGLCNPKGCSASKGMPSSSHGRSHCASDGNRYRCEDGTWVKGKACPKKSCRYGGKTYAHGKTACVRVSIGGGRYDHFPRRCDNGKWVSAGSGRCRP